jgi:hypothetical protein
MKNEWLRIRSGGIVVLLVKSPSALRKSGMPLSVETPAAAEKDDVAARVREVS